MAKVENGRKEYKRDLKYETKKVDENEYKRRKKKAGTNKYRK